jgi:HEAT repeat protein
MIYCSNETSALKYIHIFIFQLLYGHERENYAMGRHLVISFRIARTWFISLFFFIILATILWIMRFIWPKEPLPLNFFLILLLCCAFVALCIGWATAERLAIRAYRRAIKKGYAVSMSSCYQNTNSIIQKLFPDTNLLLLGQPGIGKTKELEKYLFSLKKGKIAILIQMKYYDGFVLKNAQSNAPMQGVWSQAGMLMTYLSEKKATAVSQFKYQINPDELVGIQHIRAYLPLFIKRKRIIFLCDGLNELSVQSLTNVCQELRGIMQTGNRVVMTCRELDFEEQDVLKQFEVEGLVQKGTIPALALDEIEQFTRFYLTAKFKSRKKLKQSDTATIDQIVTQIMRTSQRYDTASPFILTTLINTLMKVEAERANRINSRGRLLQESITLLLQELTLAPAEEKDLRFFLSVVACTARRNNQRNAIPLGRRDRAISSTEALAQAVIMWLDENSDEEDIYEPFNRDTVADYLDSAQKSGIITISRNGVLSYKHELIAEYFAAEYLRAIYDTNKTSIPFWRDMFLNDGSVGTWSEPVAIWAGLADNPMHLAEDMVKWAEANSTSVSKFYVLMISLTCVGVVWYSETDQSVSKSMLPESIQRIMSEYVGSRQARDNIARVIKKCAGEGGIEVYRSLPPLLATMEGMEELLLLLDKHIISDLLYDYLQEIAELSAYALKIKPIINVLGRLGSDAIQRAIEFSDSSYNPSLRSAAIRILGHIKDDRAVATALRYLDDAEEKVNDAAIEALIRLGPAFTLNQLEELLANSKTQPHYHRVHWYIAHVFEGFLKYSNVTLEDHRRITGHVISFLSSEYSPQTHRYAKGLLLSQTTLEGKYNGEKKKATIEQLLFSLDTKDTQQAGNIQNVIHDIGIGATDSIISYCHMHTPPPLSRARIIEVMGTIHDNKALPFLLDYLSDDSPPVQDKLTISLSNFAPESISPLIDCVMSSKADTLIVQRAAHILIKIGKPSVILVSLALSNIQERGTLYLVHVLSALKAPEAIPYLIKLLYEIESPNINLTCYVIQVLGSFRVKQVVAPLIDALTSSEERVYETAIEELSKLGEIAFDELIDKLDVEHETATTRLARTTLVKMQPFLQEQLLNQFAKRDTIARQVKEVFKQNASNAASFIVNNLFHQHPGIRNYVRQTIWEMKPAITVSPLIEALHNPDWQPAIEKFLLSYPLSIPLLIRELGSVKISEAVFTTLLAFDSRQIIPSLVIGLADGKTRQRTKHLIETLVSREQRVVADVISLFDPAVSHVSTLPQETLVALQEVLTQELADVSLPELIKGLGERALVDACSETLVILSRKPGRIDRVVQAALNALTSGSLLNGAKLTLVKIGQPAVEHVSLLLDEKVDSLVAAGQDILSRMGSIAFHIIYKRLLEPKTEEVAAKIYRNMSTASASEGLAAYLSSPDLQQVLIGLHLLYIRVDEEDQGQKIEMIPAILEQTRKDNISLKRVLAALLIFNGSFPQRKRLAAYIVDLLLRYPEHHKEFLELFPFLGKQAVRPLERILNAKNIPPILVQEAVATLGLITRHEQIETLVSNLATREFAIEDQRTRLLINPLHFRALGGLLASGNYNSNVLIEKRSEAPQGSSAFEFYDVLLGTRNMPEITRLHARLEVISEEKDQLTREVNRLTQELATEKATSSRLRTERNNAQTAFHNAQQSIKNHNDRIADLNGQISELNHEVSQLRQQLSRRNHGSSPYHY